MQLVLNVIILFLIFLAIGCVAFESKINDVELNLKKAKIITFVMAIGFTFRSLGLDIIYYQEMYDKQAALDWGVFFSQKILGAEVEPGFILIMVILKAFNLPFEVFLLVSVAIPFYIILFLAVKSSKHVVLVVSMFFLLFTAKFMDAIRAGLAASLFLLCLYQYSRGKYLISFFVYIISILFHYSNAAAFFAFPFFFIRWDAAKIIAASILSALIGFLVKNYLIIDFQDSEYAILWKLSYYINSDFYKFVNITHAFFWYLLGYIHVLGSTVLIFYISLNGGVTFLSRFDRLAFGSMIVGLLVCIFFAFLGAEIIGLRLHFFFGLSSIFLIPKYLTNKDNGSINKIKYTYVYNSLLFYNAIYIVYSAGIFVPGSPLYLGN